MSSRAWLVDLIHSIGEKTALADHLEEKIGEDDIRDALKSVLTARRKQMDYLLRNAQKANPTYWCAFKHAIKTYTLDVEVYEATLSDEAKEQMVESANILASITSLFLGMEFTDCARCLYDKLLVKQVSES